MIRCFLGPLVAAKALDLRKRRTCYAADCDADWRTEKRRGGWKAPPSLLSRFQHDVELLSQRPPPVQWDPELQQLHRSVQALIRLVDELADAKASNISQQELARVRKCYQDFTAALETVSESVLGSKPLSVTGPWAPLLVRFRYYICGLFSWGVLTEKTVAEVSHELNRLGAEGLLDPLAGTGWHAHLFQEVGGLPVIALDAADVKVAGAVTWSDVKLVPDSRTSWAKETSDVSRWALLLSWPPHSPETVGEDLLRAWPGHFFVYVGEGAIDEDMGLTGGRSLLECIDCHWEAVKTWPILRWPGFRDNLVRVVRFYKSCPRPRRPRRPPPLPAPDRSGHCRTLPANSRSQWALPDFICQLAVGSAGFPLLAPDRSGRCRTSAATARSQWAPPDFSRDCLN
eukprot:s10_g25.t1